MHTSLSELSFATCLTLLLFSICFRIGHIFSFAEIIYNVLLFYIIIFFLRQKDKIYFFNNNQTKRHKTKCNITFSLPTLEFFVMVLLVWVVNKHNPCCIPGKRWPTCLKAGRKDIVQCLCTLCCIENKLAGNYYTESGTFIHNKYNWI